MTISDPCAAAILTVNAGILSSTTINYTIGDIHNEPLLDIANNVSSTAAPADNCPGIVVSIWKDKDAQSDEIIT